MTSLVQVGEGATIESDVDLHGWWLEGSELVVGDISIGAGARVGTRTLLAAGSRIGDGAEIEPGSYVIGTVPAGERWSGSPATRIGDAGDEWPWIAPDRPRRERFWRAMFVGGLAFQSVLPLLAATPGLILLSLTGVGQTGQAAMLGLLTMAPAIALLFLAHLRAGRRGSGASRRFGRPARLAPRGRRNGMGALVQRGADGRSAERPAAPLPHCLHPSLATARRGPDRQRR